MFVRFQIILGALYILSASLQANAQPCDANRCDVSPIYSADIDPQTAQRLNQLVDALDIEVDRQFGVPGAAIGFVLGSTAGGYGYIITYGISGGSGDATFGGFLIATLGGGVVGAVQGGSGSWTYQVAGWAMGLAAAAAVTYFDSNFGIVEEVGGQ